ncbi:DUF2000 domain-containing protein [Candidatus Pantoea deserta]|uniref:DUF2000 domain-containing protein n=1 Tax=Candidatus Pantoea deserta TaxID=1869313 RepID=A0A3N4NTM7_9GAMM|nr:DUF2000 domain-containing protein [Pantoea deserta]RPD96396.1 DUF2000 domain-containing protein [Pantoea deserta]
MQDLRCVMILQRDLAPGKAANAAAVIALTLGQRHAALVGDALQDANACYFPGLIPSGIPVLAASHAEMDALRLRCAETSCDLVLFPEQGQTTTDYAAFSAAMRDLPATEWRLLGLGLVGEKQSVRKLTSKLTLFS